MKLITNCDMMDKERFTDNITHLPRTVSDIQRNGDACSDLLVDSFGMLFKYAPIVQQTVDTDRQLNQHILNQMSELTEYKQLRNFTVGDAPNSMGSLNLVKQVWDALPKDVKHAQQDVDAIGKQIDAALDNEYDPKHLEGLFRTSQHATDELSKQIKQYDDEIRQAVRIVLSKTEQDVAEGEQAVGVLGWGRTGAEMQQSPSTEDKLQIMSALKQNKKLQEIIRMAGRMTNIAQKKQHQKVQYARTEIVGIEQGDDLPDVIPSEYGYFMHDNDALKTLFMKRLSQSELLQYEMESKEPKAQGPVIVLIDCSKSMSGDPDTWSKACALAMYSIARKQKRDFSVMLFNTAVTKSIVIKKGEHKAQDLIAILTAGTGGGTSFEIPLTRASELIQADKNNKADLVVITDGICDITDDFKTQYDGWKKTKEFSTYTIIIGGSEYEKKIAEKFSENVTMLSDMLSQNEGQAFDVVFGI